MKNAIDVRSIVKKFGDFTAVDGVSFAVEEGEIFGLLGPNGAGKSTLIRMLVTLLPPTAGTALVGGFDIIRQADDVRRTIGVIPQAMTSDLELSVEENLLIYSKLYGVAAREAAAPDSGAARIGRAAAVEGQTGQEPLRRHAAPRRNRARPRPRAARVLPRRTDDRSRSGLPQRRLGNAAAHQEAARPDDSHHDALHGRSGQAVRSDRHRRSRQAGRARFSADAEGLDSRQERARGEFLGAAGRLGSTAVDAAVRGCGQRRRFRLSDFIEQRPRNDAGADGNGFGRHVTVHSLSVQSTTLDDVFVHYTGRALRDALQEASAADSPFMLRRG